MEVIVVDNASSDDSRAMLGREFPNVQVIALDKNLGMAGYTVGFEQARGEIVFQMDNDSLMPDEMILEHVRAKFAQEDTRLAVVATRVEEYRNGDAVERLRQIDRRRGPLYTGGFHSGGVAFRRDILAKIGGYNRDVFLYGSEMFLQMQFLAAGFRIAFYPEILMLHKSSRVARSAQGLYYELRNRYWFMRCFANRQQQAHFLPLMMFHDFFYTLAKRKPEVFLRSLRDGMGTLPHSLMPLHSNEPTFIAKVEEIGAQFNLAALGERIKSNLRGRSRVV